MQVAGSEYNMVVANECVAFSCVGWLVVGAGSRIWSFCVMVCRYHKYLQTHKLPYVDLREQDWRGQENTNLAGGCTADIRANPHCKFLAN